jgi:hypothetical protein
MLVLMETGGLTFFFLIFKGANWKSSGFTVTDTPKKIFKWTQDHKRGQHQPLDHNHSIHCLLPFGPDCQFGIHQDSSHAFVRCNVLLYTCMLGSGHIDQHHKLEVVFFIMSQALCLLTLSDNGETSTNSICTCRYNLYMELLANCKCSSSHHFFPILH